MKIGLRIVLNSKLFGIFFSGLLGAVMFFLLYSELLNPSYIDWIIKIGGDPFQHYIGWELFRSSPWTFPIGTITNLAYPVGVPVTFTDSIPLFAIVFKLFSPLLSFPFQFDGIWMLSCFILQGVFGYRLTQRYLSNTGLAVLGSLFFILSPIMLFRLGGHSALGAHWLILWSLFLVLEKEGNFKIGQWTAILILSLLIHPYLFFMCGAVFVADIFRRAFITKNISWKRGAIITVGEVSLTLLISYVVGVFSVGGASAPGYGVFSLDLNALVNPYGWSTIIQNMNVREPNEGFNYLGLGILCLLFLSIYEYLRSGEYSGLKKIVRAWWPLVIVALVLTLVAITNTVSVLGREALHVPLPRFLVEDVFGIVRSSGRLFWPVYYLIVIGSLFVIKKSRPVLAYCLLAFALAIQVYDMKDKLFELNGFYANKHWENPLVNPFWDIAAQKYQHISFIPTFAHGRYEAVALYVARHGLTLNTGYVVRSAGLVNEEYMKKEVEQLKNGMVNTTTLYIFLNEKVANEMTVKVSTSTHKLRIVDGYTVLAPEFQK